MKENKSKFTEILRTRQEPHADSDAIDGQAARRGRPGGQGKRHNPNYAQVTAYIPKALHAETKVNLIRQGNREFSELVEELLSAWNSKQPEKHRP